MYIGRNIENINEAEISIEGKDINHEECRLLWAKQELIFKHRAEFWKPIIVQGRMCFDYMHGKIFDSYTRAIYEQVQKKIVIEPRLMKPRVNSLVGQIMSMKRSGKIATEGGMSAEEVANANVILKFIEQSIGETELHHDMLFNGCVSCSPQVLWFDYAKTAWGDQTAGLTAEVLPWDAFVLSENYRRPEGDDVDDIIRIARKTRTELIDENPDREKEINAHFNYVHNGEGLDTLLQNTSGLTIEDARNLNFDALTSMTNTKIDGRMLTCDRLLTVKKKVEVAIAVESEDGDVLDYQLKPGTWSDERWAAWKEQNKQKYVFTKPEISVLWNTRWTREGLMLKNEIHWFQEHDKKGKPILPISVFTPQIIDGLPSGPGVDMVQKILMKAIAETEQLHDIRTGSGDLFAYKKGAIENYEELPTELSVGNGIIQIDPNVVPGKIRDSLDFLRRTPNTSYGEYSQKVSMDLEAETLINSGMMGLTMEQQSGKAKNTEIAQAIIGYSILADNYNRTFQRTRNIECMLVPYVFTEEQLIQIKDDDNNDNVSVMVNQEERDLTTGEVVSVTNDLTSVNWRWRLVPGDDSPTARQQELNEMLIFWNTAAPSLIDADNSLALLSSVLVSMSNKTAKEVGKVIAEKAKVQSEQMNQQQMAQTMAELEEKRANTEATRLKAERSGFSFSVTPEDLALIPGMYDILVRGNYINTGDSGMFQRPGSEQRQITAQQPAAQPLQAVA